MLNILIGLLTFYTIILFPSSLSYSNIEFIPLESKLIGEDKIYIVKKGDSLNKIAQKYNLSPENLLRTNKLGNSKKLIPGQRINVSSRTIIPKEINDGLIINLPEYKIYYFKDGKLNETLKISIGKRTWETPRGKFRISNKSIYPTWRIPPGMAKKLNIKKTIIPPGPKNPLGKYWIGLDLPHIGIHSTNQPYSIGKARSHGCMRLKSGDAEKLYYDINIGTEGEIIYEPVKVAYNNGDVYLEVHEDIYNLVPDLYSKAIQLISEYNLINYTDLETVKNIVNARTGIATKINYGYKPDSETIKTSNSPNKKHNSKYDNSTKKSTKLWGSASDYKN